ncbi:lysophospholipid acyltransferase family protein [Endozoicomonadaceae bacterium StTr2]
MQTADSPFSLPRRVGFGVEPLLEKVLGLSELRNLYDSVPKGLSSADFLDATLQALNIESRITLGDISRIPESGPLVVVANHPFGGIEGVVLAQQLIRRRPDVRVLTNEVLKRIPELDGLFIGVDLFGGSDAKKRNRQAIEEATQWVRDGGALIIFPAGEVSSLKPSERCVTDPQWRRTAARIIQQTQANVTPVFIEGTNGWPFQMLGLIHERLRTVRLVRELLNKQGRVLQLRIGEPLTPKEYAHLTSTADLTEFLRLNTYLLAEAPLGDQKSRVETVASVMADIAEGYPRQVLVKEVATLPPECQLMQKGDMAVYCTEASAIPHVLQEIGRQREIAFRAVGEGTGKSLDLDSYDRYYLHLFLWNHAKGELVGAYRLGRIDQIMRDQGLKGIYSRSLFKYNNDFLEKMGTCLEMGRSFVCQDYQRSMTALLMLWRGIGAYVVANPRYRVLFGPVSISGDYSEISRQLMAGFLQSNNYDAVLATMVRPTSPLKSIKKRHWSESSLQSLNDIEGLSSLVQRVEGDKGIPILLKQYLKLRGELAGFNVDKDFNNALDGLIIVDLMKVDERTLKKYMGPEGAGTFRSVHSKSASETEAA